MWKCRYRQEVRMVKREEIGGEMAKARTGAAGNDHGLSPEHQQLCEEIRELLDRQQRAEISAWYAVGQKVAEVLEDAKPGDKAVYKIAKAVGRDASLLYEAGKVAKVWPQQQQFQELANRSSKRIGKRLCWSHFLELANVTDDDRREQLTEKAINDELSVRALKKAIAGSRPEQDEDDGRATSVEKALRSFKAASETTVENSPRWDKLIFDVLAKRDKGPAAPRLLALLADAREVQLQAKEVCDEQLAKLDACIEQVEKHPAKTEEGQALGRPSAGDGSEKEDDSER